MCGRNSGVITMIKTVPPLVEWGHYCIHRKVSATKKMPPDLKSCLDEVAWIAVSYTHLDVYKRQSYINTLVIFYMVNYQSTTY